MSVSRRGFIKRTGQGFLGVGAAVSGGRAMAMSMPGTELEINPGAFNYGVASGDPLQDRVILWTHFKPTVEGPVDVEWRISTDPSMNRVVNQGTFRTDAQRDYTVKVDADGLSPGVVYYYQFSALGKDSSIGRTRTVPEGDLDRARLAIVSCSSYPHGYFNVYRILAERNDIDAIVHLGDYLYEYGQDEYSELLLRDQRSVAPSHEIVTLTDYRLRHAYYKLDDDLMAVHQQHPFITVWDDHEFANDTWTDGAENHNKQEGEWQARKAAAKQAYFEWMPIRDNEAGSVYRTIRYGNLMDLIMLDTRVEGREEQPSGANKHITAADPSRTLLGYEQEAWLSNQLSSSTAQWKVLGQQVMMAQRYFIELPDYFGGGASFWLDSWDGYAANRARFLQQLKEQGINNVVVLTGDVHSSFASDLSDDPYDPDNYDRTDGEGSLAVEFVCPSVTSPGFPPVIAESGAATIMGASPHIKYAELRQHGYMILDVNKQRAQAEWYYVNQVLYPSTAQKFAVAYASSDGENRVRRVNEPCQYEALKAAFAPSFSLT